jgi:Phage integrase, N-terminal SAM-like domain
VTHLRKMMLEELQARNYAQDTIRHYLRAVEDFARRFRCSPDRLGPRHIREYQAELFQKRKLSANSIGQHLAALRFFYIRTLRRAWSIADTPYPKKTRRLPTILSREEVVQLLQAAHSLRTHPAHEPLRHRRSARRVDPSKSQRHRQSAHGSAHPRRQGPQRSRCHAQSQATYRAAGDAFIERNRHWLRWKPFAAQQIDLSLAHYESAALTAELQARRVCKVFNSCGAKKRGAIGGAI